MWRKDLPKYVAGLALAALLLAWVLRGTDLRAVGEQLRATWIPGLLISIAFNLGHNVFRVWRWRALLDPVQRDVPFSPMFDAVILGYLTTWVVPGRLGELVRPALLSGRAGVPIGACMGSVVVDRLMDGLGLLLLFGIGLTGAAFGPAAAGEIPRIRGFMLLLVLIVCLPLIVLLAASSARTWLERRYGDRDGLAAWLARSTLAFSRGTEALRHPRLLARIAFHTVLAWLMIAVGAWLGIRACGAEISMHQTFVLLPLLALGIALPTPGGAGGYHAAMTFGLTHLFGIGESVAVGTAFAMHLTVVIPVLVLGFALLSVRKIPLGDLLNAARQIRNLGAASAPELPPARPAEKLS